MPIIKQQLSGQVVSSKSAKTVIVAVKSTKIHPKYQKRYSTVKRYMAHYELETPLEVGQEVVIVPCRPISKNKKWQIVSSD